MRSLSENISKLAAMRAGLPGGSGLDDRLIDAPAGLTDPGALRGRAYVPADLAAGAPLVVALHGCTQSADGYDRGTGWSALAERHGFALLAPEQVRGNNPNLCFNWFQPHDIARVGGEAESIAAMTSAMLARYDLDRRRVFVTGLSAGGAMAAVMLATHPDLFAGGAVVAGLPYGCATGVPEALRQMREQHVGDDAALADRVRSAAGGYGGPWPSVSFWHGTADATVDVSNMDRSSKQWRRVHGVEDSAPEVERGRRWERRRWRGADGRAAVEEWRIADMGHGVPLDAGGLGQVGPYMLDVGLSSTAEIARTWGLLAGDAAVGRTPETASTTPAVRVLRPERVEPARVSDAMGGVASGVQETIERALRSAGLMR